MPLVEVSRVPEHVAIVMDGNGRWAELRGQLRHEGHREGSEAVRRTVRAARRLGVRALTLYAFSEQNWDRPPCEVHALMGLLREFLVSERAEILDNAIRLRAIGRLDRLPTHVREVLEPLAAESADARGMTLTLALSYGGREELVDAARAMAHAAAAGTLDPELIDVALLDRALPSMDVGPVDLLVRTGGEQRISNFVLWAAAYAELFFTPTLWPDYGERDLYAAVAEFQRRDRRFGRVDSTASEPRSLAHAPGSSDARV